MTTSTKLTNSIRDAYIEACMSDVPRPDYKALEKEAQDLLYKAMSPAVRKVFREEPNALKYETFSDLADRGYAKLIIADVKWSKVPAPVLEKAGARMRVKQQIRTQAYACKTGKQLEEALPQFAHHVPKPDQPTPCLPVPTRFLDDLKMLGFQPKIEVEKNNDATT
jgi:hypothetical protein